MGLGESSVELIVEQYAAFLLLFYHLIDYRIYLHTIYTLIKELLVKELTENIRLSINTNHSTVATNF
jgi:hypothetical protein